MCIYIWFAHVLNHVYKFYLNGPEINFLFLSACVAHPSCSSDLRDTYTNRLPGLRRPFIGHPQLMSYIGHNIYFHSTYLLHLKKRIIGFTSCGSVTDHSKNKKCFFLIYYNVYDHPFIIFPSNWLVWFSRYIIITPSFLSWFTFLIDILFIIEVMIEIT